jgi:Uma2 family endonuclease
MVADILEKKAVRLYSLEEYFELEEKAAFKSEYRNGQIIPVHLLPEVLTTKTAGSSSTHNRIKGRLHFLICLHIEGKIEYEAFDGDQNVYIPKYKSNVYPDICVVNEKAEMFKNDKGLLNPALVIEVLSDSTGNYDKRGKFHKYQSIPSFQEYVLIEQDTPIIDILTKTEDGWLVKTYIGLEEEVYFKSIDATFKMSDIYSKVKNLKDPQAVLEFNPDDEV